MSSAATDVEVICDRVRGFQSVIRGLKSGKPDGATTGVIQEAISMLSNFTQFSEVVTVVLQFLDDVLAVAPQTATLIRLEGGTKLLLKVLKNYTSECTLIAAAAKVLCRCCVSSTIIQQGLVKEKGFATVLLNVCNRNSKEALIVGPIFDAMMLLSRYSKGAQQLAGDTLILLCKEALVNFLGSWSVFGSVLKVLKNISKHDGPCQVLARNDETMKLLLGVMRLLTRLPDQRKLLKRTSRTLWLLNRHVLSPLPDFEPIWRHPSREAQHLNILSAMDADVPRHQELFPEDYGGARAGSLATVSHLPPQTVRPIMYPPDSPPPTAADVSMCIAASGNLGQVAEPFHSYGFTLDADMMMHDLRRVVHPEALINRRVYVSTTTNDTPSSFERIGSDCLEDGIATLSMGSLRNSSEVVATGDEPGSLNSSGGARGNRNGARKGSRGNSGNSERSASASEAAHGAKKGAAGMPPPLEFSSSFESGNLRVAVQVYSNEYDLFLGSDINDRSDGGNLCQWFFFSVSNVMPGISYKFNLVNFRKKESLFSQGKQPLVCMGKPPGASSVWELQQQQLQKPGSAGSMSSAPDMSWPNSGRPWSGESPMGSESGEGGSKSNTPPTSFQAASGGGWVRAGHNISYYPSPYRGRKPPGGATAKKTKKVSGATDAAKKSGSVAGAGTGGKLQGSIKEVYGPGPSDVGPGLYCSTFTLQFEAPGTYYIASCYPYTYTDLQEHLDALTERVNNSVNSANADAPPGSPPVPPHLVRSTLCSSLGGNHCELLTITDFNSPIDVLRQRECIMLTARVHPGETCASWIMQGILDFLTSDHPTAQTLRASFIFKIMPMLNPDGVINGSYRCSLAGQDLNRTWDKPIKWIHPTIYHTKKVLQQLAAAGKLALYVDIHGHSNKEDTFFYGCEPNLMGISANAKDARPNQPPPAEFDVASSSQMPQIPGLAATWSSSGAGTGGKGSTAIGGMVITGAGYLQPTTASTNQGALTGSSASGMAQASASASACATGAQAAAPAVLNARLSARLRVRMLPYLASRISPDFSMPKCSFKIRRAKLSAARVVVNREMGVAGSYTMEASLGGQSTNRTHFSGRDYMMQGHNFCRAVADLAEVDDATLLDEMNAKLVLPPYTGIT